MRGVTRVFMIACVFAMLFGFDAVSQECAVAGQGVVGCSAVTTSATGTSDVLASSRLEDYGAIAGRNFFSARGGAAATEHTELTAVVWVDGTGQAWVTNRLDDTLHKTRAGDELHIGTFHGLVAEIAEKDVVLESEGQRWLLSIQDRLADAIALPPEY